MVAYALQRIGTNNVSKIQTELVRRPDHRCREANSIKVNKQRNYHMNSLRTTRFFFYLIAREEIKMCMRH